ncbi:hypothetical protein [Litorivivens sp.]|uniref:hypothetical protein n=1 Tax=Litorivivens sp. TaxID=2020868 RepID=UPI003563D38E
MVATRYPGFVPVVGFVWLEFLPLTVILFLELGWKALFYPLFHYAFLALYEVGYLYNDRAKTSVERPERGYRSNSSGYVFCFVIVRVQFLLIVAVVGGLYESAAILQYLVCSVAVLMLLFVHTWVGELSTPYSNARFVTFSWLAFLKYFPATLLFLSFDRALAILVPVFIVYGSGRVVAYILSKCGAERDSVADGPLWFFCSLPVLYAISGSLDYGLESKALIYVFGSYYLVSWARKLMFGNDSQKVVS